MYRKRVRVRRRRWKAGDDASWNEAIDRSTRGGTEKKEVLTRGGNCGGSHRAHKDTKR